MSRDKEIKISVRNLVEFILRSGNLDNRFVGHSRGVEGTKAHQKIQKLNKKNFPNNITYLSEISLKYNIKCDGFTIIVEGRADGIILKDGEITIDEIKTTTNSLQLIDESYNSIHWAQAKCYAYIYGVQKNIDRIKVQLTYYQLDSKEIKYLKKDFHIKELKEFFFDLIYKYFEWANITKNWNVRRDISIKKVPFPFNKYRKGQRKLAVAVYRTIMEEKNIFVQASTGIGKTISTVFPAVKAIGEGLVSKIFYLTAKTITKQVAEDVFIKMKQKGLEFKSLTLTAKDKICFKEESNCNPDYCEFAKGHFNRVNNAIKDVLYNENIINRSVIEKYAKEYKVCPFELSLDLTIWVDCIICDYNYVFDPKVYLKSFFDNGGGDYIFLIDEAHNLVDRSREMFSSELHKKDFLELKKILESNAPKVVKCLNKINRFMLNVNNKYKEEQYYIQKEAPKEIYPLLRNFISEAEKCLTVNNNMEGYDQLLQLYFDVNSFIRISELYDKTYITYVERLYKDIKIKLFCIDPEYLLEESIIKGRSAIFFSATLTPIKYFREILGGNKEDYIIHLSSPFNVNNRLIFIADNISTKYKDRENSYFKIVEYIKTVINEIKGNYLVFFPSYEYMNKVFEIFFQYYPEFDTIVQSYSMSEKEKEQFLDKFREDNEKSLVGFAVLGGVFSEGIDLVGEKLFGAIIIGVGLPKICFEKNIIKDYFNNKNGYGYEYAYMYPGMNKVLQASGRVIRSEKDKGIILLIDERFSYYSYKRLFPKEWCPNLKVKSYGDIIYYMNKFCEK